MTRTNMTTNPIGQTMETVARPIPRRQSGSLAIILFILLVVAAAVAVYFYLQTTKLDSNPQEIAQAEIDQTIARVGELMLLPENEQPTVALITEPEKLADQPFFAKAKQGDRVLIYPNAGKIILYDPVAHKIIDVGPVNIGQTAPR